MQGAQEGGPVGTLTADPCYIAETNIVKHPPIKNKFKKRNETNLFRKQRHRFRKQTFGYGGEGKDGEKA